MHTQRAYGLAALLTTLACGHRLTLQQYIDRRVKTAPTGALACYNSPTYGLSDTLLIRYQPPEPMWLVLDSIKREEDSSHAASYLISQRHRDRSTIGRWRRLGDSIHLEELSAFPNSSWMLFDGGDSLVGRGNMVHDVGHTDSNGRFVPDSSEWRAHARRVPCTELL